MPVLQISKPHFQSFVILIGFAALYAMIYDMIFIWTIIIGLLAIVTLACLAYIAYISYFATLALKDLVSKRRKKHMRKENQKKSNEIF